MCYQIGFFLLFQPYMFISGLVPVAAIHFDGQFDIGEGQVNVVAVKGILGHGVQAHLVQAAHDFFGLVAGEAFPLVLAGNGRFVPSLVGVAQTHRLVVDLLVLLVIAIASRHIVYGLDAIPLHALHQGARVDAQFGTQLAVGGFFLDVATLQVIFQGFAQLGRQAFVEDITATAVGGVAAFQAEFLGAMVYGAFAAAGQQLGYFLRGKGLVILLNNFVFVGLPKGSCHGRSCQPGWPSYWASLYNG